MKSVIDVEEIRKIVERTTPAPWDWMPGNWPGEYGPLLGTEGADDTRDDIGCGLADAETNRPMVLLNFNQIEMVHHCDDEEPHSHDGEHSHDDCPVTVGPKSNDAIFIARARTLVPEMCDELDRLRDALQHIQSLGDDPYCDDGAYNAAQVAIDALGWAI